LISNEQFIGTVIYAERGVNLPVAAAYTLVPVTVMVVYLFIARRLKAFEAL
jgi:putative spermidine/putrescine transport system permease protein